MVSLNDLAKELGLSPTTVSRALSGEGRVGEETRRRVRAKADALGYRPSVAYSRLMRDVRARRPHGFHRSIAWLDFCTHPDSWTFSPVITEFIEGAREKAAKGGYAFERIWVGEPPGTLKGLDRILRTRGIDGVMFSAGSRRYLETHELPFRVENFALVSVGHWTRTPDLHLAGSDQFQCAKLATRELARLGYRRIGYATSDFLEGLSDGRFLGGYLAGCALEGIAPAHGFCTTPAETLAWYRRVRPDAVISPASFHLEHLRAAGVRVPGDVAYAGLDCDAAGRNHAGVYQNSRRVGEAAVDVMGAQFARGDKGPPAYAKIVLVEGQWVDGATAPGRAGAG